ncbi:MAG TPA: methyl-accepting chemotaxis protein [Negativicutes bacterium]|jgi:methyl-accepting chemotaxis protein
MNRFVFAPFVNILNLLNYQWKFLVVFFIILIPIIVVMNVSITNLGDQIDFNTKEGQGLRYINPLRGVLTALVIPSAAIDEAGKIVDQADAQLGATLKVMEKWSEWKNKKSAGQPADLLIQDTLGLISHVGDTSNLILDPDLDSYYLMDSVVNKLPQVIYSLHKINTALSQLPTRTKGIPAPKNELISLRTQVDILLEGETAGLQIVYRENDRLQQQLSEKDKAMLTLVQKTMADMNGAVIEAGTANLADIERLRTEITDCIRAAISLHELHSQALDGLIQARIDKYTSKRTAILIAFVVGIIAFLYCFMALYRSIIIPIRELEILMAKVQVGNLNITCPVKSRDEFGELARSFNAMISGQREIVEAVRTTAIRLSADSQEMAASSQQVTCATNEISSHIRILFQDASQARQSIQEISAVLTDLSGQILTSQEKAESAALNSQTTCESAESGGIAVKSISEQISNIQDKAIETSNLLEALNEATCQIDNITQTINGIANQTNLLALNAAIEAARAGESGRGFSVVAEEVRKLAEQSASQAAEVSLLLKEITTTVQQAVNATRYSNAEVVKGVKAVDEAGKALSKIAETVNKSVDDIAQIKQANTAHSGTSNKVQQLLNSVITSVDRPVVQAEQLSVSTTEIAKAIENVAASVEQTNQLAFDLRNMVGKFILE